MKLRILSFIYIDKREQKWNRNEFKLLWTQKSSKEVNWEQFQTTRTVSTPRYDEYKLLRPKKSNCNEICPKNSFQSSHGTKKFTTNSFDHSNSVLKENMLLQHEQNRIWRRKVKIVTKKNALKLWNLFLKLSWVKKLFFRDHATEKVRNSC